MIELLLATALSCSEAKDLIQDVKKEKIEFINEIYRVENVLDARIDTILNELK